MNEKIGMYTEEEIFQEIAHGFLGRSMYDAIFDKIHALKTENEQLQQENTRLKEDIKNIINILRKNCDDLEATEEEFESLYKCQNE